MTTLYKHKSHNYVLSEELSFVKPTWSILFFCIYIGILNLRQEGCMLYSNVSPICSLELITENWTLWFVNCILWINGTCEPRNCAYATMLEANYE